MSDIFVQVIGNKLQKSITKATRTFDKNMESFTLINKIHNHMEMKIDTQVKSVIENIKYISENVVEGSKFISMYTLSGFYI